jgi:hypothetical protein
MNSKRVPQEFDARDAMLRRGRRCARLWVAPNDPRDAVFLMPPPLGEKGQS